MVLDELQANFQNTPPEGPLPDLNDIKLPTTSCAHWELDTTWQDTLKALPHTFKMLKCTIHDDETECMADHDLDTVILFRKFVFIHPHTSTILTGVRSGVSIISSHC